jgi:hypothetical protein
MDSALKKQIIEEWTDNLPRDQKIIRLFEKVRDIPYGDIGSRDAGDIFRQNKGTCSGKHELLKELYREIGVQVKDFLVLHRFRDMPVNYPTEIREILNRSDIPDPHNFIKIRAGGKWVIVEATWDKALKKLGFIVNENWDGKSDMKIAVAPGGKIPESTDSMSLKKELIGRLSDQAQKDRKLFLQKLTAWLDDLRAKGEI